VKDAYLGTGRSAGVATDPDLVVDADALLTKGDGE
jgi:hypothetical protein